MGTRLYHSFFCPGMQLIRCNSFHVILHVQLCKKIHDTIFTSGEPGNEGAHGYSELRKRSITKQPVARCCWPSSPPPPLVGLLSHYEILSLEMVKNALASLTLAEFIRQPSR